MGYSGVSPGVRIRHLEGPKNPDGLNFGMYVFVYVYKLHMYMLGGGMGSWTDCLLSLTYFLFRQKQQQKMWTQTTDNLTTKK